MNIQFKEWNVTNLNFSLLSEKRNENTFSLDAKSRFQENEETNNFEVIFKLEVSDKAFDLVVEAIFNFETDSSITENFKLSHFPKVNAPAIAYPYLRAFISNVTLQSGLEPVILPTINFVKLAQDKEQQDL